MPDSAQPESSKNSQATDARAPIAATVSLPEPSWHAKAATIAAAGTWFKPRSRRGLLNKIVIVRRCPACSEPHSFRDDGVRIAPCGARLTVKARKGRTR